MTDKRAYFRVDVGYLANPKIGMLLDDQPRAILLHLQCIAYATQHATDGKVPMRLAMRQACAEQCDLDLLMHCGLLEPLDDANVYVHDYLEHQRSASEVKTASDKARQAAEARWKGAAADAQSTATGIAPGMPNAMPRKRERSSSREDAEESRLDVERLCRRLADRIEGNGSKRPQITAKWRSAARLMLDKDGRSEEQIARCIDWCQADPFWRANIFGMPKLREKYDQLRLKAAEPKSEADEIPWHQR